METRRKPQLLLSLIVFSVLLEMSAWPLAEARFMRVPLVEENELDRPDTDIFQDAFPENGRSARQADEIFTGDLSRPLDDLSDKFEVFNEKRDLDNIAENDRPVKRSLHSILTDLHIGRIMQAALHWALEEELKDEKKTVNGQTTDEKAFGAKQVTTSPCFYSNNQSF